MKRLKELWSRSLCGYLWEEFAVRWRFKFVLPKVKEVELEGLKLDVGSMPLKVRNRMLSGAYEAHEKQMCRDFLSKEDAVLELGGAIGFIGLLCQKELGIRKYYCVEANPRTVEVLRRNYELNGVEPRVWNLALADHEGTVGLSVDGDFWENSIVPGTGSGNGAQTVDVPATTLGGLLRRLPEPVNVLIVDIEGAEQYIDAAEIPAEIEKIIVELHPQVLGAARMYRWIAGLIQHGFEVAREEESTFMFVRAEREKPGAGEAGAKAELQEGAAREFAM